LFFKINSAKAICIIYLIKTQKLNMITQTLNQHSNREIQDKNNSEIQELLDFGAKYFVESFAHRYEEIIENLFPENDYKLTPTGIESSYYIAGLNVEGRMRMIRGLFKNKKDHPIIEQIATSTKFLKSRPSIENKIKRDKKPKDYYRGTLIRLGEPYSNYNQIYEDIFKIEEMFGDEFYLLPLDDDNRKSGVKAKLNASGYSDITLRFARHGSTKPVLEWQINSAACEKAKKLEDENYGKKKILITELVQYYEDSKSVIDDMPEIDTGVFMTCLNAKCRFDLRCQFSTPNSFGISELDYNTFINILDKMNLLDNQGRMNTKNKIISDFSILFKNGYSIYEEANPIINNVQSGIKFIEGFKIAQTEHKKFKDNPKANS
jgi:hypothetical protein